MRLVIWARSGAANSWRQFLESPRRKAYVLMAIFVVVLYGPFVARGGLQYDDWSVDGLSKACSGVVRSVTCYWPGYPDRPLAAPYYAVLSNTFGDWAQGYILVSSAAWLAGVSLIFRLLKKRFGFSLAAPFFFVAALPSVASTVIFSPAMQGIGTMAFLLWALSLSSLDKYVYTKISKYQTFSCLLLLCSLFLYESSMPLFAFNILWPFLVKRGRVTKRYGIEYTKEYILPVLGVLSIVFIYQKFVVLHFFGYISKLRIIDTPGKLDFGLRTLVNDIYVLTLGAASISGWALLRLRTYGLFAVSTLLIGVVATWHVLKSAVPEKRLKRILNSQGYWLLILLATLVAFGIAVLHFAAVLPPTLVGYNNRGVLSGAIVIALLSAIVWQKYCSKNRLLAWLWVICFLGYSASFTIQRTNFTNAAKERNKLLSGAVTKLAETEHPAGIFVLADVPIYTDKNFNNETIFSDEVFDWGISLSIRSGIPKLRGISVSPERIARKEVYVEGGNLVVKGMKIPIDLVWFYSTLDGKLTKVETANRLGLLFESISVNHRNYPAPVDARTRNKLRQWLVSY